MTWIALKMLTGNRAKYYAIIFGISFASMLMTQQASIFVGLMRNTSSQIRDISGADIWVMDPSVQFIEDITPLDGERPLPRPRRAGREVGGAAVQGHGHRPSSTAAISRISASSAWTTRRWSAPRPRCSSARIGDLRRPDAVIIDERGYQFLFPGQPLRVGWTVEMNDHRALVVGICKSSPSFQTYPDRLYDV